MQQNHPHAGEDDSAPLEAIGALERQLRERHAATCREAESLIEQSKKEAEEQIAAIHGALPEHLGTLREEILAGHRSEVARLRADWAAESDRLRKRFRQVLPAAVEAVVQALLGKAEGGGR